MEKYTHACIKCNTQYESNDIDPYYCSECELRKKEIAKSINISTVGQKPMSDYQMYENIKKQTGSKFVNIKQLGL